MSQVSARPFGIGKLALPLVFASFAASANDFAELKLSADQFAPTESTVNALLSAESTRFETTAIASLDRDQSLVRLESAWTHEFDDDQRRVRIGDSVSNPGSWGSAVRFAGVQFGTPFELRSDLLNTSRMALAGVAVVPTTADAVLSAHNARGTHASDRGMSVRSPSIAGANNMAVTASDAGGRRVSVTQPLVPKMKLAESGCNHYSLSVGRARVDYALVSNEYGPWFANTTIVCGTNTGLAVEAHGEYLQGTTGLAGLNLTQSLGELGAASVAVATSENVQGSGWLVKMGLQHANDLFEVNVRTRRQSPEFRELGEEVDSQDAVAHRTLASVGAKLGDRSTFAVAYTDQTHHDNQRVKIVGMSQTIELGRRGKVSIVANRAIDDARIEDRIATLNVSYQRPLP